MKIYRHKNGKLYYIFYVTPRCWCGKWYEAYELFTNKCFPARKNGNQNHPKQLNDINDFTLIAER